MLKPLMSKQCSFCGDNFTASKSTARFCCNSCRTKANIRRRLDEQAKADLEAKQMQEQEQRQKDADTRRLKREQKADLKRVEHEQQSEIDRQAKEAKRIKDEQDAVALVEKNRKDEEERQKQKQKYEADMKQLKENKVRRKNLKKKRNDKEIQYNRTLMVGKGLLILGAGAFIYQAFIKPKEKSSQTAELPKPDEFPPKDPSSSPLKDINQTDNAAEPPISDVESTN